MPELDNSLAGRWTNEEHQKFLLGMALIDSFRNTTLRQKLEENLGDDQHKKLLTDQIPRPKILSQSQEGKKSYIWRPSLRILDSWILYRTLKQRWTSETPRLAKLLLFHEQNVFFWLKQNVIHPNSRVHGYLGRNDRQRLQKGNCYSS